MIPPVGVCCNHKNITPSPMQHSSYREGDDGWIYYHGFYLSGRGQDMKLLHCFKPEPWRWKHYLRRCGECSAVFSNPWVPVCDMHWSDWPQPYPSWEFVIALDKRFVI